MEIAKTVSDLALVLVFTLVAIFPRAIETYFAVRQERKQQARE